jgi:hypothetical protein
MVLASYQSAFKACLSRPVAANMKAPSSTVPLQAGRPCVGGGGNSPAHQDHLALAVCVAAQQGRVVRERLAWAAGCRRFDSVLGIERPWPVWFVVIE